VALLGVHDKRINRREEYKMEIKLTGFSPCESLPTFDDLRLDGQLVMLAQTLSAEQ
jgi:hypothetical protein